MPIVIGILTLAILLVIGMRLAERLGYPFWYGLAIGVPVLNLFVLAAFAFKRSPRERRIDELEQELAALRRGPPRRLIHDPKPKEEA
jgi:hypothetical protein